jgi:Family of unknown function (DUF6283)
MTGPAPFPHRAFPCVPCPVRADNHDHPNAKFPARAVGMLSVTVRDPVTGRHPTLGDPLFGCHKGEPATNNDLACAGWLARFGADHVTMRAAITHGRLPNQRSNQAVTGLHYTRPGMTSSALRPGSTYRSTHCRANTGLGMCCCVERPSGGPTGYILPSDTTRTRRMIPAPVATVGRDALRGHFAIGRDRRR